MSDKENAMQDGQIPAKCSWNFTKKAAALLAPSEKTQERQAKEIMEQINIAGLAAVATGKPVSIVITLEMNEGLAEGFQSEIQGEALEAMAKMDEKEIITAIVPQLVHKCNSGGAPDFGAFLNDLLSGIGRDLANDDDEGSEEEGEPAADKPQEQAAS